MAEQRSKQSSSLRTIDHLQKTLFDGYIRLEIVIYLSNINLVPTDVLNLCFKFFHTNLNKFISSSYSTKDLIDFAKECFKSGNNLIAFQLSNLAKVDDDTGESDYLIGKTLFRWKEDQAAELAFKASLNIVRLPSYRKSNRQHHYGLLLQSQHKHDLAIKQFENAFKASATARNAYECGYSHQRLENHKQSEEWYLKAIKLNQKKYKYRYRYGKLLKKMGNYDKAIMEFTNAMNLADTNKKFKESDCMFQISNCYVKLNDFTNANKCFLKLLATQPENIVFCLEYAIFLKRCMKDYSESEKYYLKCLEIDDKQEMVHGSYAHLFYLQGKYQKALKYSEIELGIKAQNMYTMYNNGYFNHLVGNTDEAEKRLGQALDLIKTERDKEKMLDALKHIKETDEKSLKYPQRFAQLIKDKFGAE